MKGKAKWKYIHEKKSRPVTHHTDWTFIMTQRWIRQSRKLLKMSFPPILRQNHDSMHSATECFFYFFILDNVGDPRLETKQVWESIHEAAVLIKNESPFSPWSTNSATTRPRERFWSFWDWKERLSNSSLDMAPILYFRPSWFL